MWASLVAVMIKELRQAFRDRRTAVMLIVAPVIQMTVFGYAVNLDVDHIPTAVFDADRGPASRELAAGLLAGTTFDRAASASSGEEASRMLETGQAAAAVILEPGFGRHLAREHTAPVQVLVDGSDPNRAQIAANAAVQYGYLRSLDLAEGQITRLEASTGCSVSVPRLGLSPRIYFNPRLISALYMVPGVAVIVLLVVTTMVTAMGLAREREAGTMEQIMVTPIRPAVLLTGKCLPFAAIGLVDIATLVLVGSWLFDVPIRGPLLVIFAGTLLYSMSTLGMGIFVSTIGRTQQQAVLGAFFFAMPAILLSGFLTPIENMPAWVQPITYLNPCRFFLEIMRGCLLKGAGFEDLSMQLGALAAYGLLILTLSALRFRKRLG
ncbi:MAG: ABC transporter permease [Deltaproteobacteria bacterium]|nr:ABC transporter permease [Deltaproteobacteria bacterium]